MPDAHRTGNAGARVLDGCGGGESG
jgi:hypothetical protein